MPHWKTISIEKYPVLFWLHTNILIHLWNGMYVKNSACQPHLFLRKSLQRDRHAEFMNTLAVCGCSLEKFATEIRHLQKTEVREAEEFFFKGTKKVLRQCRIKRNPIVCERIGWVSTCASLQCTCRQWRMLRYGMNETFRIHRLSVSIIPDSCIILDFILADMTKIIDKTTCLSRTYDSQSQCYTVIDLFTEVLLALTKKGMKREDAYRVVQEQGMKCGKKKKNSKRCFLGSEEVMKILSPKELNELFDPKKKLWNISNTFLNR